MSIFQRKRLMALAGMVWLAYLLVHMLANLNFLTGEENFNGFYQWFNNAVILRWGVIGLLTLSLGFHVVTAVSRQLDSNAKRHMPYKKPYPKAIPRFVAWSGATLLLSFIVFHFVQMQLLPSDNFYQEIRNIFTNPLMLIVYVLGFVALFAHLYHALSNVRQTFGLTQQQSHGVVLLILSVLLGGFAAIPISIYL